MGVTSYFRKTWRDLSLRGKAVIVIVAPIAASLVGVVLLTSVNRSAADAQRSVDRTLLVRETIHRTLRLVLEAQGDVRAAVITREPQCVVHYPEQRRQVAELLNQLRELTSEEMAQRKRVVELQRLLAARYSALDALVQLVNRAGEPTTRSRPQQLVIEGSAAMSAVQSKFDDLDAEEQHMQSLRFSRLDQARQRSEVVSGVTAGSGAIAGIFAAALLSGGIVRRLRRLEQKAQHLAEGHEVAAGDDANDEIASLENRLAATSKLLAARVTERDRTNARLEAIVAIQQEVATSDLTIDGIMSVIARRAQRLTQADSAVVELAEGEEMVYRAVSGGADGHLGLRLNINTSFSGLCVRKSTTLCCDDSEKDSRVDSAACRKVGARSMVVAPLRAGDETVGALKVFSAVPSAFDQHDIAALELMAGLIGTVIYRRKSEQERRSAAEALHNAKEEAERANRAKSEFLSRMSHELRTPLNAILGFGQLLEIDVPDEAQRESARHIVTAGNHLLSLINEVLDISRIEAGGMSLSLEPVALGSLIDETLSLVRPLATGRKIRLVNLAHDETERFVLADRQRMKQVLINLLSNAIKYNRQEGEVRITVRSPAAATNRTEVQIIDTGIGLPPEKLARLFTAFDRLGAEQTNVEGTGLGLALSKRLVELMGGLIVAQSEAGVGSTFTVELEAAADPTNDSAHKSAQVPRAAISTRESVVLYIEDNPSNLKLVERILEHRPRVRLLSAIQGSVGLDLAREHRPDIILLDVHLPDLHGGEVLQRLRADERTHEIPVVMLTADATASQIERLRHAGANAYITKPLNVQSFLATIDEMLAVKA